MLNLTLIYLCTAVLMCVLGLYASFSYPLDDYHVAHWLSVNQTILSYLCGIFTVAVGVLWLLKFFKQRYDPTQQKKYFKNQHHVYQFAKLLLFFMTIFYAWFNYGYYQTWQSLNHFKQLPMRFLQTNSVQQVFIADMPRLYKPHKQVIAQFNQTQDSAFNANHQAKKHYKVRAILPRYQQFIWLYYTDENFKPNQYYTLNLRLELFKQTANINDQHLKKLADQFSEQTYYSGFAQPLIDESFQQNNSNIKNDPYQVSAWQALQANFAAKRLHIHQLLSKYYGQQKQGLNLLLGLSIGDAYALSQDDWQLFNEVGVSHLIAISGTHITLMFAFFYGFLHLFYKGLFLFLAKLNFLKQYLPFLLNFNRNHLIIPIALLLSGAYVLLSGFGIPAQRTWLMLCLLCLLKQRLSYWSIFSLSLYAISLLDVWAIFNTGFILSFSAVALLLYLSGQLVTKPQLTFNQNANQPLLVKPIQQLLGHIQNSLRLQWRFNLLFMPIMVALFSQFPLASPIINLIAIPYVSFLLTPLAWLITLYIYLLDTLQANDLKLNNFILLTLKQILIYLSDSFAYCSQFFYNLCLGFKAYFPVIFLHNQSYLAYALAILGLYSAFKYKAYLPLLGLLPLAFYQSPVRHGTYAIHSLDVNELGVIVQTKHHHLLFNLGALAQQNTLKQAILPYLKMHNQDNQTYLLNALILSNTPSLQSIFNADNTYLQYALNDLMPIEKIYASSDLSQNLSACNANWQWDGVNFKLRSWQSQDKPLCFLLVEDAQKRSVTLITPNLAALNSPFLINYFKQIKQTKKQSVNDEKNAQTKHFILATQFNAQPSYVDAALLSQFDIIMYQHAMDAQQEVHDKTLYQLERAMPKYLCKTQQVGAVTYTNGKLSTQKKAWFAKRFCNT